MHPADAIAAYRAIIDSGKDVDDVAASFGVSPAYVRRVLKLAALHPTILKAFQKDEIGMGAAQAFALTVDQAAYQRRTVVEFDHAFGVQQHMAFLRGLVLKAIALAPGRDFAAIEAHRVIPLCQTRWSVTLW